MIKEEVVTRINEKTGIEKAAAKIIVDAFMETICEEITNGECVYLRGFGTFGIKHKALRHFNYAPGKMKVIPEHNEPSFKPSAELKEAVRKTPLK